MFLSGGWLEKNGGPIISPFIAEQIDCAAYTMRVGDEAYVSPEGKGDRKPALLQLGHEAPIDIPPGQFGFLVTREFITVPPDLIAFINMKNTLKSSGLINVSGFHVDPGYKGKLVFSVFNAGPKKVTIRQNQDAFLIWFARIEAMSDEEVASGKFVRNKPGFAKIDSELMSRIPAESASLNSLNSRIEELRSQFVIMRMILTFVGGITVSAVAALIAAKALEIF